MSEIHEKADSGRDPTTEAIRDYIYTQFPHAKHQIRSDDDQLLANSVVDSLGILEIVEFLVEKFQVEVTDEDLNPENFGSINALAAFVRGKREA